MQTHLRHEECKRKSKDQTDIGEIKVEKLNITSFEKSLSDQHERQDWKACMLTMQELGSSSCCLHMSQPSIDHWAPTTPPDWDYWPAVWEHYFAEQPQVTRKIEQSHFGVNTAARPTKTTTLRLAIAAVSFWTADRTCDVDSLMESVPQKHWSIPCRWQINESTFLWAHHLELGGNGGANDRGMPGVVASDPSLASTNSIWSSSGSERWSPVDTPPRIMRTWSTKPEGVIAEWSTISPLLWSSDLLVGINGWPAANPCAGGTPGSVTETSAGASVTPLCGYTTCSTGFWPVRAFMFGVKALAGWTAGPPVMGGRTAVALSLDLSWAWIARASFSTIACSFLNSGLSLIRCKLFGLDSTAIAEIRGPVSSSIWASISAVQWAWTLASCDNWRAWSGLSTRAKWSRHHLAFLIRVGPDTLLTKSHDGGAAQVLHATSSRSAAL